MERAEAWEASGGNEGKIQAQRGLEPALSPADVSPLIALLTGAHGYYQSGLGVLWALLMPLPAHP